MSNVIVIVNPQIIANVKIKPVNSISVIFKTNTAGPVVVSVKTN
jgi:hypothetical protein